MTAFRDQFERRDPFTFNALGLSGRHRNTLFSARKLLEGRTTADLGKIGSTIDDLVTQQAVRVAEWAGEKIAESRLAQAIASMLRSAEYQRDAYGDLQLLQMAGGAAAVSEAVSLTPPLKLWEPWAVLALWKVYDYIDRLLTAGDHAAPAGARAQGFAWTIDGDPTFSLLDPSIKSRDALAGLAAEASAAATKAEWEHEVHQLMQRVHTVASKSAAAAVREFKVERDAEDAKKARDQAKVGAEARHGPMNGIKREVIQLFRGSSFKSTRQAAKKLTPQALELAQQRGVPWTGEDPEDTVYKWLLKSLKAEP